MDEYDIPGLLEIITVKEIKERDQETIIPKSKKENTRIIRFNSFSKALEFEGNFIDYLKKGEYSEKKANEFPMHKYFPEKIINKSVNPEQETWFIVSEKKYIEVEKYLNIKRD